jgi:ribose/xylose/arabinose/galactoside ABC-type transport system permease subunit
MTRALRRLLFSEYFVLWLAAGYFALLWPLTPGLASPQNLGNIFSSMLPLLVVAVGQTFVLVSGGIDLSVTATIALASTAGALVMTADGGLLAGSPWAIPAGVAVMLAAGAALGLLNGAAITALRMPPFIVTLATMMFFGGFAIWLTQSQNIYNLPAGFNAVGRHTWSALLVAGAVAVAAHFVLGRSTLGRWLYAVGLNAKTALVSGVPVRGTLISAYVICGLCAAAASVLYTARLETGSPVMGQRILLDVIGAAVIGGVSLFGGKGKVIWTVFGVLFMTLIDNSLNLLGLSNFAVLTAKGVVILMAALLDAARNAYARA